MLALAEGFDFLGFHIQWKRKRGTTKHYIYTFIGQRPIRSLKAKIRALTNRTSQQNPRAVLIRLNQIMRGWANYFKHAACKRTLSRLSHFVWWRVIRWLRVRRLDGAELAALWSAMLSPQAPDTVLGESAADVADMDIPPVRKVRREDHLALLRIHRSRRAQPDSPHLLQLQITFVHRVLDVRGDRVELRRNRAAMGWCLGAGEAVRRGAAATDVDQVQLKLRGKQVRVVADRLLAARGPR